MRGWISHTKNLIMLLLVSAVILLMIDKCGSYRKNIKGITDPSIIDIKKIEDSIRTHYEQYTDTIIDTLRVETEVPFVVEKPVYVMNTPEHMDLSDTNVFYMREFVYEKQDSLLNYQIIVTSLERPDKVNIKYDLKNFTIRDSVYVRDSISTQEIQKVRVNQLYVGPEAIVYPNFRGVFFSADFISKNGWQFEAGAGLLNDKTIAGKVGLKKVISFR